MMNKDRNRIARICVIVVCLLVFGGLIVHSLTNIRYSVIGESQDELTVTDLSVFHRIERAEDGEFIAPEDDWRPVGVRDRTCPT